MKNLGKKAISTLFGALAVANMMTMTAFAEGDVAGAVENTWNSAKSQIKSITNNVIFPIIDVVLVILLFVKIGAIYLEYKKHGQLEWTPAAILFGELLFSLTAPLYIWSVVNI